jgi:hypothetical protein
VKTYIDCTFVGTDLPESTPPDEAGEFEDCMHEFLVAVSEIPKPFDPENFPEGMIVTDAELVFLLRKHFSPLIERLAPRVSEKSINEYSDERADIEGCKRFQEAMLKKLSIKRAEGKYGWNNPDVCSTQDLAVWLEEHFKKGDPVDIANYCMMIWNRVNPLPPQKGST